MKNKVVIIAIASFLMLLMACNPETPVQYHKVTYIGADGNVMETHDVENGKADIPPQENPTNVGYELIGWSLSEDGSEPYDISTPITDAVTLYPIFEGKEMTVNFIYEDKEPINSKTLKTGDKVSLSDLTFKLFEKEYALDDRIYTLKLVDAGTGTQYSLDEPLPYSETGFTFVCHISSNLLTVDGSGAVAGTNALIDIEGPYTLIIPRYLNGVEASTIKETGFDCSYRDKKYQFDKLILPNTLTSIGVNAFSSCVNLAEVEIPSSVELINASSFNYCTTLSKINIPEGVETIGDRAFANCSALSEINLPFSLATIGMEAFSNCGFVSFTLPKQFTVVPEGILYSCKKLTTVIFEGDITTIGAHAFADCDALTSFTIPDTVTTIRNEAFFNCKNLETITLPNNANITEVSNSLFNGCWKLTNITIPASVTNIGDYSFYSCKSLQSIIIPENVTTIGESAFSSSGLTSIIIPSSVTSMGALAFQGCNSLASITINGAIETIQEWTFEACTNLSSIRFPNSVQKIERFVFNACGSLNSVIIGSGITTINENAFVNCTSLTDIYINKNQVDNLVPSGSYSIHWNSTGPTTV